MWVKFEAKWKLFKALYAGQCLEALRFWHYRSFVTLSIIRLPYALFVFFNGLSLRHPYTGIFGAVIGAYCGCIFDDYGKSR